VPDDQGGDDDVEDLSEDSFWGGLFGIHYGGGRFCRVGRLAS
jgi:hypothetical protein